MPAVSHLISLIYISLFTVVILLNKYVLSVLGFRFPMVFQGWQTLVGFIVLHTLKSFKQWDALARIPRLDKTGLTSLLPNFLLFTLIIVSGSKALSMIPVSHFLAISNLTPVVIYLFDNVIFPSGDDEEEAKLSFRRRNMRLREQPLQVVTKTPSTRRNVGLLVCFVVIVTSVCIALIGTADLVESDERHVADNSIEDATVATVSGSQQVPQAGLPWSPYTWMFGHVGCQILGTLHSRLADARYNSADRLYYSLIFSLVVLAPASIYLEEAFAVLRYEQITQIKFMTASLASAILGVALHLCTYRLRTLCNNPTERIRMSVTVYFASLLAALFSLMLLSSPTSSEWIGTGLSFLNLTILIMGSRSVVSHIDPDDRQIDAASFIEVRADDADCEMVDTDEETTTCANEP